MNTKFDEEIFTLYKEFFKGAKIVGNVLKLKQAMLYIDYSVLTWPEIRLSIIEKYKVV